MLAVLQKGTSKYTIDLSKPLDISIPLKGGKANINAWYLDSPSITPHIDRDFIGEVASGASTNFNTLHFNPHSHVTHTECLGHITKKAYSINQQLQQYFWRSTLLSVAPEAMGEDLVITKKQLQRILGDTSTEAVIIRTLPNSPSKKETNYSNSNPPYLTPDAMEYLVSLKVMHLLVDLPSVDKEKDGGVLSCHNLFWNTAGSPRTDATITEFIYVPNSVEDGSYILSLQVAPIENDASPSRPVLYKILE